MGETEVYRERPSPTPDVRDRSVLPFSTPFTDSTPLVFLGSLFVVEGKWRDTKVDIGKQASLGRNKVSLVLSNK